MRLPQRSVLDTLVDGPPAEVDEPGPHRALALVDSASLVDFA
jgi:hypothetical protein